MTIWVCKFCKSDEITYWDNAALCTTFDWGFFCENCKKYIDPYDEIEIVERDETKV